MVPRYSHSSSDYRPGTDLNFHATPPAEDGRDAVVYVMVSCCYALVTVLLVRLLQSDQLGTSNLASQVGLSNLYNLTGWKLNLYNRAN